MVFIWQLSPEGINRRHISPLHQERPGQAAIANLRGHKNDGGESALHCIDVFIKRLSLSDGSFNQGCQRTTVGVATHVRWTCLSDFDSRLYGRISTGRKESHPTTRSRRPIPAETTPTVNCLSLAARHVVRRSPDLASASTEGLKKRAAVAD